MTMFVALNQAGKLTDIENAERGLACDVAIHSLETDDRGGRISGELVISPEKARFGATISPTAQIKKAASFSLKRSCTCTPKS
mgnify:CR=1 FL=1